MKTSVKMITMLLISVLILGCGIINFRGLNMITPSDTIITDTRDVADFSKIDLSSFGKMVITQGDSESLTIKGSDNIVPLVETTVNNGVLTIGMKGDVSVNVTKLNSENMLTFTITVKDLAGLMVSGAGDVEMDALTTSSLKLDMSGAGNVMVKNLSVQDLVVTFSGLGNVEVAGEATQLEVEISGAGALEAGDLKCQTADITISGLGGATVWVTDTLTGEISGGGNVSYYGSPKTNFNTSGVGEFKSLGDK